MDKISSTFQAPKELLGKVESFILHAFCSQVLHQCKENLEKYKNLMNKYIFAPTTNSVAKFIKIREISKLRKSISETNKIIEECKNHIIGAPYKKSDYDGRYIPLQSIINWSYLSEIQKIAALSILKEKGWPDNIAVYFYISPGHKPRFLREDVAWEGLYVSTANPEKNKSGEKQIHTVVSTINFKTLSDFMIELDNLKLTAYHETLHLAQEALGDIKHLKQEAGTLRDKINPKEKDIEFYPMLQESIISFNKLLPFEKDKNAFFNFWAGLNDTYKVDNPNLTKEYMQKLSAYFYNLKISNYEKWKKAVKELWKSFH